MGELCPVCRGAGAAEFARVRDRLYWRCPDCSATFLDRSRLPDPDRESARYRQHRNDPADPGYREFLDRLARPLLLRLAPNSLGLDYGCGPGPALAQILSQAGHRVRLYDPLFFPDESALAQTYRFITCTETAEHFHDPAGEFDRLDRLLCPGGWLALMTRLLSDDERFAGWTYRRDPTHVVFYKPATFEAVCRGRGWRIDELIPPDIVIIQKAA